MIDIVMVLPQEPSQRTTRKFWNKFKQRLAGDGSELVTSCHRLKLCATNGKNYLADIAEIWLRTTYQDTVQNFDPNVIKLKRERKVVVALGVFDGIGRGDSEE